VTATKRLPAPVSDAWDWQRLGACRGADSAVFFHPDSERGASRATRQERAKAICRGCSVLIRCREYALAAREPYGVWGGLGEQERHDIIALRRSATPAA